MTLALLALLPWIGAVLVAALPARARRAAAWGAGATALGVTACVIALAPAVFGGAVPRLAWPWMPAIGLVVTLRLDALAWLFAALVATIGALVVLYAAWYLDDGEPAPRFFAYLLAFMGAMLGLVLAGNLLLMVVFWELTGLASFLLIGWWRDRSDARDGARMALAVTGAGGLALLAGVLLIGHIVGSFDLDAVLAAGPQLHAHPLYTTALVLVLAGAFTKSAQFPFQFWLPHAMAAPTPVSAYLHSATMVKAGVFLLARLYPALGGSEAWFWIVSCTGLATLLLGAWIAIFQHDLKGLLAYSTISHLGLVTLLFGLDEPLAVVAALFHIVNHATFKAGLFMAAGIIDHECGTRDMRRINGLAKVMPFTAVLGTVAAAAMAGVPLANGFLSKEMFFAEALAKDTTSAMQWLLPAGALVAAIFGVAYSLRFVHDVFFNGEPVGLPRQPHEAPFFMRVPVLLLVLLCIAVGLAPQTVVGPLLVVASAAVLGAPPPPFELALWHGLNAPLAMSVAALALGLALYFGLQRFVNLHRLLHVPLVLRAGGRDVFAALQATALEGAARLAGGLQRGALQRDAALLTVAAVAAGALPLLGAGLPLPGLFAVDDLPAGAAAIGVLGVTMAAATVALRRRRFVALLLAGAVGLVVCLTFAWFSAPDLALTQLLVEVASVLVLLFALRGLPAAAPADESVARRVRDAVVALAAGAGVAALAAAVMLRPFDPISPYYLEHTLALGGGANAVNVVIVDFRGFDTLGEITVLAIAALIVHALALQGPLAQRGGLMLETMTRALLPFGFLVSVFLYLRGHNLPGGGFAAGLVLAIMVATQRLADGRDGADTRAAVGWGLAVAAATGLASWLFGSPFLTSSYDYPWLPGIGGVPLASAAAFDLGVWIVVGAATLAMLRAIANTGEALR